MIFVFFRRGQLRLFGRRFFRRRVLPFRVVINRFARRRHIIAFSLFVRIIGVSGVVGIIKPPRRVAVERRPRFVHIIIVAVLAPITAVAVRVQIINRAVRVRVRRVVEIGNGLFRVFVRNGIRRRFDGFGRFDRVRRRNFFRVFNDFSLSGRFFRRFRRFGVLRIINGLSVFVDVVRIAVRVDVIRLSVFIDVIRRSAFVDIVRRAVRVQIIRRAVRVDVIRRSRFVHIINVAVFVRVRLRFFADRRRRIEIDRLPVFVDDESLTVFVDIVRIAVLIDVIRRPVFVDVIRLTVFVDVVRIAVFVQIVRVSVFVGVIFRVADITVQALILLNLNGLTAVVPFGVPIVVHVVRGQFGGGDLFLVPVRIPVAPVVVVVEPRLVGRLLRQGQRFVQIDRPVGQVDLRLFARFRGGRAAVGDRFGRRLFGGRSGNMALFVIARRVRRIVIVVNGRRNGLRPGERLFRGVLRDLIFDRLGVNDFFCFGLLFRQSLRQRARLRFGDDARLFRQDFLLNVRLRFGDDPRLLRQRFPLNFRLRFGDDARLLRQRLPLNFRLRFGDDAGLLRQRFPLNFRLRFGDDAGLLRQRLALNRALRFRDSRRDDAGLGRQSLRLNIGLGFRHGLRHDARLFRQSFPLDFRLRFGDDARLLRQRLALNRALRFRHRRRDRLGLGGDGFGLRRLLRADHGLGDGLRLRRQRFLAHRFLRFGQSRRDFLRLFGKRLRHQSRLKTLRFLLPVNQLPHRFRQNRALRSGDDVRDQARLFFGAHAPAGRGGRGNERRRGGQAAFRHRLFLHFQNFFLRLNLRLRHRFRLRGDRGFALNGGGGVVVFDHDLRGLSRDLPESAVFLNRRKQRRQSFVRMLLRFGDRLGDHASLNFRRALLGFGKRLRHRAGGHFLTLRKDLRHRFRLRFRHGFSRFQLSLSQRLHQRFDAFRPQFGRSRPLHDDAAALNGDTLHGNGDGLSLRRLQILHAQFVLNAGNFRRGIGRRQSFPRAFQRFRQFGGFLPARRIVARFGQRFRQQFHVAARVFLRLLHDRQLALVHFFLRRRQSVRDRFSLRLFFAGNQFLAVVVFGFVILAVLLAFQIFQIVADVPPPRNVRQGRARVVVDFQQHVVVARDQIFAQNMQLTIDVDEPLRLYIRILFPVRRRAGEFRLPFFGILFRRAHLFSTTTALSGVRAGGHGRTDTTTPQINIYLIRGVLSVRQTVRAAGSARRGAEPPPCLRGFRFFPRGSTKRRTSCRRCLRAR